MIPIANFQYNVQGLTAVLVDGSTNNPVSWLWDFGDSQTSTLQNPQHVYSVAGDYEVILISTNGDGDSSPFTQSIKILPTGVFIIDDILTESLPSSLVLNEDFVSQRKTYWRLYLQTLIDPFIPDTHLNDENYWPPLVNMLIAKLIISDYLMKLANEAIVNVISTTSTDTTGGNGNIKTMEMGPSKAEWFDSSDTLKKLFGTDANGNSPFSSINIEICGLASRLSIRLPHCPKLNSKVFMIGKVTANKVPNVIQNLERYANNYLNG